MREYSFGKIVKIMAVACMAILLTSSCARIPLRDGGLAIGKDTTASIEDIGVASLTSRF